MIYVGYQGVGKTSLCKVNKSFIDLESANLLVNGSKPVDWAEIYVNFAEQLNNDGYDVFMSAHIEVRQELKKRGIDYILIYPAIELKDDWERKIILRYTRNQIEKNRNAMIRTILHYDEDIKAMDNEDTKKIRIQNFKYNLEELIYGEKSGF